MTDAEKVHFREVHAQMQVGYAFIQSERDRELKTVSTTEAILALRSAFQHAASLPMRPSSGLIQFYQALAKVR